MAIHKGLLQILGQLDKVAGLHTVGGPALGLAAKVGGIAEHCRQRDIALNDRRAVLNVGAENLTAPEEYMGDVMGDINARRGQILGSDIQNGAAIIE